MNGRGEGSNRGGLCHCDGQEGGRGGWGSPSWEMKSSLEE